MHFAACAQVVIASCDQLFVPILPRNTQLMIQKDEILSLIQANIMMDHLVIEIVERMIKNEKDESRKGEYHLKLKTLYKGLQESEKMRKVRLRHLIK